MIPVDGAMTVRLFLRECVMTFGEALRILRSKAGKSKYRLEMRMKSLG